MVLVLSSLGMRAPFGGVIGNGLLLFVFLRRGYAEPEERPGGSNVLEHQRRASGHRSVVEVLDDVLREVRGVFAEPREKGRSARPLPASTDEAKVRKGGEPPVVHEVALIVLDLRNLYP